MSILFWLIFCIVSIFIGLYIWVLKYEAKMSNDKWEQWRQGKDKQ
jgi:hypothetical protein